MHNPNLFKFFNTQVDNCLKCERFHQALFVSLLNICNAKEPQTFLLFLFSFHFDFCCNEEIIFLDCTSCTTVKFASVGPHNLSWSWQFGLCKEIVLETFPCPWGYGLYFNSALWERIVLRQRVHRWAVEREYCSLLLRKLKLTSTGLTSIKSKLCNLQKDPFLRGGDCD